MAPVQTVNPVRATRTPLINSPPAPAAPSRRRPRPSNPTSTRMVHATTPLSRQGSVPDEDTDAEMLAWRLQHATDLLLTRLPAYLSRLDPSHDEPGTNSITTVTAGTSSTAEGGGMTLPLTAVAWLSSQYYPPTTRSRPDAVCPTVWSSKPVKDRLQHLQPLLSRVTHLRITSRMNWPPPLPSKPSSSLPFRAVSQVPTSPPGEVNVGVWSDDVASVLTMDDTTMMSPTISPPTSRRAFCEYIQTLKQEPICDARLFPKLQVLVLEAIDPVVSTTTTTVNTAVPNFYHQWHSTLQLLKWNRSNLGFPLASLFLPCSYSSFSTTPHVNQHLQQNVPVYSQLTHLDLSHSRIGPASGLSEILPLFPNIKALNLAYNQCGESLDDDDDDNNNNNNNTNEDMDNDFFLSGLRNAAYLQQLNLSHNELSSSSSSLSWLRAHLYLGGQLIKLDLSYNKLDTVAGIDRLYALQELYLNHNQLSTISDLASLCRLPQLQALFIHDNPFEATCPLYAKQVWAWCLDYRSEAISPQELPKLNGTAISIPQWNALVTELTPLLRTTMAMESSGGGNSLNGCRKVRRRSHRNGQRARIGTTTGSSGISIPSRSNRVPSKKTMAERLGDNERDSNKPPETVAASGGGGGSPIVSFSLQDVLVSLYEDVEDDDDSPLSLMDGGPVKTTTIPVPTTSPLFPDFASLDGVWDVNDQLLPLEPIDESFDPRTKNVLTVPEDGDAVTEEQCVSVTTKEAFYGLNAEQPEEASQPADDSVLSQTVTFSKTTLKSNGTATVTVIKETKTRVFNVMTADWDELVDRVAGGLIPDGKPRMPLPDLAATTVGSMDEVPFSEEAADLLLLVPEAERGAMRDSEGGGSIVASSVGWRSTLPDQIYPDDSSIPSSLGTNRDDFSVRPSKFQIAEENATYDGPEAWAKRNVLENLKDYFDLYVFPSSLQSMTKFQTDVEEDEYYSDRWEHVVLRYPRIQLWLDDRRELEMSSPSIASVARNPSFENDRWFQHETFVRIWEEDVIPCGRAALHRLPPNRRPRLSFHGDQLYVAGVPDPYAECRKVYLCLSSVALYVIVKADDVMTKLEEKGLKKKFPNPISEGATFEDAPWPHAVARHRFVELQTVTIGFEFQRLTLQFTNPTSRKADPFVYVFLTSNKKVTVKLLQEIQKLAKEGRPETIDLSADATPVAIENDSQDVMDALQVAVSPDVVGTIFHYQIVQQRWKHGEGRGTVRRVCVVTDTKLFLMDEDYQADSHKPLNYPATGVAVLKNKQHGLDLAKVSYRLVDQAPLNQVTEVQAAGADPKAITIMIKPQGRLSRTHRWRLICRDSGGAERLVEDVRKAMAMLE